MKAGLAYVDSEIGGFTMIQDLDPGYDVCSTRTNRVVMKGDNIGELLNAAGITWGGFVGSFDLTANNANGTAGCGHSTYSAVMQRTIPGYIPHHNWFQYYASPANPAHARPASLANVGYSIAQ